jgi:hypothetical protein
MTFQIDPDLFENFALGFRQTLLSCAIAAIVIAQHIGMGGGEGLDSGMNWQNTTDGVRKHEDHKKPTEIHGFLRNRSVATTEARV